MATKGFPKSHRMTPEEYNQLPAIDKLDNAYQEACEELGRRAQRIRDLEAALIEAEARWRWYRAEAEEFQSHDDNSGDIEDWEVGDPAIKAQYLTTARNTLARKGLVR